MTNNKKIIYIIKSEKDNSFFVGNTIDLDKCIKNHNLGRVIPSKNKLPWTLVSHFVFEREQPAYEFEKYLQSKQGTTFISKYFVLNPLFELKKLLLVIPKSVKVYVMGGLALDGHLGTLSRIHDDVDLICWRKDIKFVKKALKKLGYKIKENYFKDNSKIPYRFETDEENSAISFNIIDEELDNSFKIAFKSIPQTFPKKFLGPVNVLLDEVKFPAVSVDLLDFLNKKASKNLKQIKKENPKLYNMLSSKIDNNKNDRRLINKLIKK